MTSYRDRLIAGVHDPNVDPAKAEAKAAKLAGQRAVKSTTSKTVRTSK